MLLTQAVLATVITGLLLSRRQKSLATWLLTGVYGALTGFLWSYFMVASAYLIIWLTLVGPCIVLLGVTLIQFAYHFPHPSPEQKGERRVALGLSLLALAVQIGLGIAFWRTPTGALRDRLSLTAISLALLSLLTATSVFARRTVIFTNAELGEMPLGRGGWWRVLRQPVGAAARGTRAFMLTCLGLFALTFVLMTLNLLTQVIPELYLLSWILLPLGISGFQFTLVLVHLNYAPESNSFMARLLLAALTTLLSVAGILGYITLHIYEQPYHQIKHQEIASFVASLSSSSASTAVEPSAIPKSVVFILSRPLKSPHPSIHGSTPEALGYRQHFPRHGGLDLQYITKQDLLSAMVVMLRPDGTGAHLIYRATQGEREYVIGYPISAIRVYLNTLGAPIALVIVGSTLAILLILPLFFRVSLVTPLLRLLDGVRQVNAGDLDIAVPIQYEDEIGFVTRTFNAMVISIRTAQAELRAINAELEARVAARTLALSEANAQLEAQNAELDAFAHTVAHDLKTPLTSLIGFSTLLERRAMRWSPERIVENSARITQTGHKMTNIINELLLLASMRQQDEVEIKPLDMEAIVAEALARFGDRISGRTSGRIAEVQAEVHLPDTWLTAIGYAPWVEEVWVNYISNALKYGGTPPRVELGADLGHTDNASHIRFWVKDNGHGLTPEAQAQLFAEFTRLEQTRAKGHGLGLSIVRRIVEKLGGEVGVESEVGVGSTFWFTLPAP
jgi:signal transduction histidine kinase